MVYWHSEELIEELVTAKLPARDIVTIFIKHTFTNGPRPCMKVNTDSGLLDAKPVITLFLLYPANHAGVARFARHELLSLAEFRSVKEFALVRWRQEYRQELLDVARLSSGYTPNARLECFLDYLA